MAIIRDRYMASQRTPRVRPGFQIAPSGSRGVTTFQGPRAVTPRPPQQVSQQRDEEKDPMSLVFSYLSKNRAPVISPNVAQAGRQEEDDGWGRGLGILINNPITRGALKPLEYLDYGRRAVTLGAEELAEGLGSAIGSLGAEGSGWREYWDQELGNPDDERSNWDKLNDPTYGVGQLLGDVTWDDSLGNFFDRGVGFVGDVALDPLTYVAGAGFATKAGTAANKTMRAAMARELLDKGVDEGTVRRFVQRGAAQLTPEQRALANLDQGGIRLGTNRNNIVLPGSERVGELVGKATGAVGHRLRNAPGGRRVANWRTPERIEDAYRTMFQNQGGMKFGAAAERVDMENTWRAAQNTFRSTFDRGTRELQKMSRGLSTDQKREIIDALEAGTVDALQDDTTRKVAKYMQESFDQLWEAAQKEGLAGRRRSRYSPHILTRDAARWMRRAGEPTQGVRQGAGLVKDDLFDPSGVTMARRFKPGQKLEVNGQTVTLGDAGITDVNQKFREAGLNFDFFESDPHIIMRKYVNMLSSDVGQAKAIISRVGAGGGVHRLTQRQMEILGLDDLDLGAPRSADEALWYDYQKLTEQTPEQFRVRSEQVVDDETGELVTRRARGGLMADQDLALAARATGEELPEDLFEATLATERRIKLDKEGQPKLSRQGKAKAAANRAKQERGETGGFERFVEDDFQWTDEINVGRQESKRMTPGLQSRLDALRDDYKILARQADEQIEAARATGEAGYLDVMRTQDQLYRRAENELNALARAQREGVLEQAELEEWIGQIDELRDSADRSLRALDAAVARDVNAAQSTAVRNRMDELRNRSATMRRQAEQLNRNFAPEFVEADRFTQAADDLAADIYGPGQRFTEAAEELEASGRQQIQDLITERNRAMTRIENGAPDADQLTARVAEIDDELARLRGDIPPSAGTPEQARRAAIQQQLDAERQALQEQQSVVRRYELAQSNTRNPVVRTPKGQPNRFEPGDGTRVFKLHQRGKQWFVELPDGTPMPTALGAGDVAQFSKMDDAIKAADDWYVKNLGGGTSAFARRRNAKTNVDRLRPQAAAANREIKKIQARIGELTAELDAIPQTPNRPLPPGAIPDEAAALRQRGEQITRRNEQAAYGVEPTPNVRQRGGGAALSDDIQRTPVLQGEQRAVVQARIDELNAFIAQRQESIDALEEAVEQSRAVKNAQRRLKKAGRGVNNPARRKAEAQVEEARRLAREDVGMAEMQREVAKAKAERDFFQSKMDTRAVEPPTPEVREQFRRRMSERTGRSNREQLQRYRSASMNTPRDVRGRLEQIAEDLPPTQAEMEDIVRSGETRAAIRQQAGEAAGEARRARQRPQRVAISRVKNWADPLYLSPRRRQYVERIAQIDDESAARMVEMDTLLQDQGAAAAARKEAQDNLRSMNMNTLGRIENGQLIPPAKPTQKAENFLPDANKRVEELNRVAADDVLDPDVQAAVQKHLNDAVETLAEAEAKDIDAQHMKRLRADAASGRLGRVINVQLANGWSPAYPHLVGNDVVLSQELHESFQRVMQATYSKEFIPYLDAFTNLFKTYATATPGFHVRNALSAIFMNATDGVDMPTQLESIKLFNRYRRQVNPEAWLRQQDQQIQDAFEAAFGTGIGGRYTEPGVGQRASFGKRAQEKAFDNWYTRLLGERPGANVEGIARLAPALQSVRNGASVNEAIQRVTRLHFDYSQMSNFDRTARRLIPFWTFMSRNLPLQITQMYTKPKRYAQYNSFIRNIQGEAEPGEPDYFSAIGAFRLGGETMDGLPLYLQPDLAHTRIEEDLARFEAALSLENPSQVLSDFNPAFTTPVEFINRRNLYTGRTYQDDDLREAGPLELPFALLGNLIDPDRRTTPGGKTAYGERYLDAMRSLFPLYDRTVRLFPAATEGTSGDASSRQYESILRFLGAPIRQLSPQQQLATQRQEFYDELDQTDIAQRLAEIDAGG